MRLRAVALATPLVLLAASPRLAAGAGRTELVSTGSDGAAAGGGAGQVSDDGRRVAFTSRGGLVAEDRNRTDDVYVRDRATGTTTWVSARHAGAADVAAISGNGRVVSYSDGVHLYVHDLASGRDELADVLPDGSVPSGEHGPTVSGALSADGRTIAFSVYRRSWVLYVRDLRSGTTRTVTGDGLAHDLSADGSTVLFSRDNGDAVAADLGTGRRDQVDVTSDGAPGAGTGFAGAYALSGAGRYAVFTSPKALVPGVSPLPYPRAHGYLRDRATGTTTLVCTTCTGLDISADGGSVTYEVEKPTGDRHPPSDVLLLDRRTGTVETVTVTTSGGSLYGGGGAAQVSSSGRFVTFLSKARYVAADDNSTYDTYLRDRGRPAG